MGFTSSHMPINSFDAPHTFTNVKMNDIDSIGLDTCSLEALNGMDNVVVEITADPDHAFSSLGVPGFLVSKKFVDFTGMGCAPTSECLDFCPNACLRTLQVLVDPTSDDDTNMLVVDNDTKKELIVTRSNHASPTSRLWNSVYNVALPRGRHFDIYFVDKQQQRVYPNYATPVFERAPVGCTHYVESIEIHKPEADPSTLCDDDLIRNGNFDANRNHWQDFFAGAVWEPNVGVNGGGGFVTKQRTANGHEISQWINVYCIQENATYDVSITYKLLHGNGNNNNAVSLTNAWPYAQVVAQQWDGATFATVSVTRPVQGPSSGPFGGGFETITGVWTPTAQEANSDRVMFLFSLPETPTLGVLNHVVDNISMTIRR
eukprot:CAMPEP_0118713516 /NCGR_PEP_ID=MMETSP0800-20121206/25570_1 /TAXON_ID=210618 ORGANISM="Striatella unipunctata, Strain CCMP2910" /NCGR_SAMPLE_ID=MMETSP0800 /ASSEMBLY_ACC=CAM_ASM_000638 /LENGTH=373 /DNA_ID=CAMNT_0006618997 /DNA_START=255 /DNA_END=1376 /DNA_ORIENTATION=+